MTSLRNDSYKYLEAMKFSKNQQENGWSELDYFWTFGWNDSN